MRPRSAAYYFWKILICVLILLMTLIFSAPICYILRINDFTPRLASTVTACASFFLYLLVAYFLALRSDLSHISARAYLLGEICAYAVVSALSALIAGLIAGGMTPPDFSYGVFVFLPCLGAAYLTGNLIAGAALQIAAFALCFPFVYLLKNKKDPTLTGGKKQKAPEAVAEENAEEQND